MFFCFFVFLFFCFFVFLFFCFFVFLFFYFFIFLFFYFFIFLFFYFFIFLFFYFFIFIFFYFFIFLFFYFFIFSFFVFSFFSFFIIIFFTVGGCDLNQLLTEVFSDAFCLYVALKQACIRINRFHDLEKTHDNVKESNKEDQFKNNRYKENHYLNKDDEEDKMDEFLYFYYYSLHSLSLSDDLIIQTFKNLKRILIDIMNFQIKLYSVSTANFMPLPAYCFNLMPKKIKESLTDNRCK